MDRKKYQKLGEWVFPRNPHKFLNSTCAYYDQNVDHLYVFVQG